MRYLKKIFEDIEDFVPNVPENWTIHDLQSAIDEYDKLLSNDKIWKDHYLKFKDEYSKMDDDEFEEWKKGKDFDKLNRKDFLEKKLKVLNDISNFAENRLKEVKKEKEEDIELIKDLVTNYLEDCDSFESQVVTGKFDEYVYSYTITLSFTKKCLKARKPGEQFQISENEILDYWENIIQLIKVLKSYDFESNISYYQPNGTEMKIKVKRNED